MRQVWFGVAAMSLVLVVPNGAGACDGCAKGGQGAASAQTSPLPQTYPLPQAAPIATASPAREGACPCCNGTGRVAAILPPVAPPRGGCGCPTGRPPALEANRPWNGQPGCNLYYDPAARVYPVCPDAPRAYYPVPAGGAPAAGAGYGMRYPLPDAPGPMTRLR